MKKTYFVKMIIGNNENEIAVIINETNLKSLKLLMRMGDEEWNWVRGIDEEVHKINEMSIIEEFEITNEEELMLKKMNIEKNDFIDVDMFSANMFDLLLSEVFLECQIDGKTYYTTGTIKDNLYDLSEKWSDKLNVTVQFNSILHVSYENNNFEKVLDLMLNHKELK